jgi:hypothetical protein
VTVEDVAGGKRVQFRLHDKLGALDKLGRHLGLFGAKHKQPDAPAEVDIDDMRDTVLRALARLHDARRAGGGGPGAEPRKELQQEWKHWARKEQRPPPGDWRSWLYLAGRGAGKTRSGAEWIHQQVGGGRRRIALVAPTAADARDVMVEGERGILAVSPDDARRRRFQTSLVGRVQSMMATARSAVRRKPGMASTTLRPGCDWPGSTLAAAAPGRPVVEPSHLGLRGDRPLIRRLQARRR